MTRKSKSETYREKGRAVFLAAIMVLSMVALGATFAGGAAAQEDLDVTFDDQVVEDGSTTIVVEALDDEADWLEIEGDTEGWTVTDMDPLAQFIGNPDSDDEFPYETGADESWFYGDDAHDSLTIDLEASVEAGTYEFTAIEEDDEGNVVGETDFEIEVTDEPEDDEAPILFFPDQTSDSSSVYVEDVDTGAGDLAAEEIEIWADTNFDGELDSVVGSADAADAGLLTVELDTDLPAAEYDMRASMVDADGEEQYGMDAAVNIVDPDKQVDADAWEATHWEGQVLEVDLSDADVSEGDVVQVREVLEFDNAEPSSDRLTRELPVNSNEAIIVDTARLRGEGDYLIAQEGNYLETDTNDFTGNLEDAAVAEVLEQDLSTDFQDEEIRLQGDEVVSSDIDVESVRLRFDVLVFGTVDGDLLDEEELDSIFGENSPSSVTGETPTDVPYIVLPNVQDASEIEAQFDEEVVEDGEYDFDFDVADSTAADSANISVLEAVDEEVTIDSPTTDDRFDRGDIVPIELDFQGTDAGTITFGDREEGQNVEVNLTVYDDDGSGDATVLLNTFQLGNEERNHGFMPGDDGTVIDDADAWSGMEEGLGGAFVSEEAEELLGEDATPGGAVIASASYDLVSTHGEDPWKVDELEDDRSVTRVDERDTESFDLWTAPGTGDSELEAETVEDVEEALDDGQLTEADGEIANRDFMILQMESTGLEGLLHEALITNEEIVTDEDGAVSSFNFGSADGEERFDIAEELVLDREDDHDVGDAFTATQGVALRQDAPANADFLINLPIIQQLHVEGDPDPNVEQDVWQGFSAQTLAGTDDDGNLNEYFIVADPGSEDFSPVGDGDHLTPGTEVTSIFEIGAVGADPVSFPQNIQFVRGESEWIVDSDGNNVEVFSSEESETAEWDFVFDTVSLDGLTDGQLNVPQEENVEITGQTPIAGGTNLSVRISTASGEDEPFFKSTSARVQHNEGEMNTISLTEDFDNATVGTEFNVRITREGAAGILTADGERVPGVVTDAPAVNEFEFSDQRQGGSSVVVQTFNSTQGGFIGIYNDAGDRIGQSSELGVGEHTNVPISLDPEIDENQDLTATAYMSEDRAYVDEDGDPVQRTAAIEVEELDEASFSVNDLDPQDAELEEPGAVVDVSATVTNDGDEEGTTDVELRIDGDTVDSQSVTLDGGESESVTFEADTGALEHGETYIHSVWTADDEASGTLTIEPEPTPTPEPDTPTPTPEPADDTDDTADDADDDGAGFGVIVALLAFLGAALLAVRRQTRE